MDDIDKIIQEVNGSMAIEGMPLTNEDKERLIMSEKEALKLIGETGFRELFHKIVYIQPTEEVRNHLAKSIDVCAEDDGFLAYGYIDNQAGFSFRIICSANIKGNTLTYGKFHKESSYIIRRGYFNSCNFVAAEQFGIAESDFDEYVQEYIQFINDCYKCSDEAEEMRKFTFLDPVRSTDYPDDIQVILYQKGMQPEQVWVKCYTYTDKELFGVLLNEPNQDFGIHNSSIIGFTPMETANGLLCVYTGRWLEKQSQ